MNYVTVMKEFLDKDVVPLFINLGFKRKQNYFIREQNGRLDVIQILYQRGNRASHASFSFALGFIAPKTYYRCTGKKQPFLFSKKILFYVPFGVLLCAKENFTAGFDYTYELYGEHQHYDELPYAAYQQARPDLTKDDFDRLHAYYEELHQRYDHETTLGLLSALQEDVQNIITFFDSLPCDGEMLDTFMNTPPKNRLEELLYFAFEDFANQHGKLDVAIAIRMQLNNRISKTSN